MDTKRILVVSLLITMVSWAVFSWPLPQYFSTGVARSAERSQQMVRTMVPGDHLQLMYHFWLAGDMVSGKTPVFQNLYEFNEGNDEDCTRKSFYFAPYSLASSLASLVGGRAFGWNFASILSLWVTYLFTWRLVARHNPDELQAAAAALVGLLLPFRWFGLCEGSPVGFAISWIPALMLGIDTVMRKGSKGGAALAGCALLFSAWGDAHVFLFSILMIPAWGIVTWISLPDRSLRVVGTRLMSVWPAVPFALLSLVNILWKQQRIDSSGVEKGWDLAHVGLYSPTITGLFSRSSQGDTRAIYIGWFLIVFVAVAAVVLLVRALLRRTLDRRRTCVFFVLLVGMLFVILLAMGTRGPAGAALIKAVRIVFSPYRKIRQPDKIFVVLPSLLAIVSGIALSSWIGLARHRLWKYVCVATFAAVIFADYSRHIAPEICLIDLEQKAYEAIVTDAAKTDNVSRAVAIPLWPGDSHWSSLYEHYASLYRIRFLNGYSPVTKGHYFEEVFLKLKSLNMGEISENQFKHLEDMGIQYLVLHEDAFPEKVSVFPVAMTLKRLLNHPRLELLRQEESVWSFKITNESAPREAVGSDWQTYFPCRRWEAERIRDDTSEVLDDTQASRGRYRRVTSGDTVTGRGTSAAYFDGMKWQLRTKGEGVLKVTTFSDDEELCSTNLVISTDEWEWVDIPIASFRDAPRTAAEMNCLNGSIDLDLLLLSAGEWVSPDVGGSIEIPSACFFHAGYTDIEKKEVVLRASRDAAEEVVYARNLLLDPGTYRFEMAYSSESEDGTVLGSLVYRNDYAESEGSTTVKNGSPAGIEFVHGRDVPVRVAFRFIRSSDMRIGPVTVKRIR